MTTGRVHWFLAILLACLGACAHLPDVSWISDDSAPRRPPRILSARGLLSREKSRAILDRLTGRGKPTDLLQRHAALLEMVSGSPLTKGNKVTLLIDGKATYAAMFEAIASAGKSINLETFKIDDDETGNRFGELLLKKQATGVQVNLMYDSMGSFTTPALFFDRLRQAGVHVVEVNPRNPVKGGNRWLATHADHRKMLIVDGRLVITGGVNISKVYTSKVYTSIPFKSDRGKNPTVPWRDTDIRLEGPVVAQFQKFFVEVWLRQKGPPLSGDRYFPRLNEEGGALVRAISSTPGEENRVSYISYVAALSFAEHSIYLTNAYFIPDDHTLDALTDAARRGVDVKILLPSISDSQLAFYAMRHNYTDLLKAGVKLYQRRKALLHAKTAVIDGVWSTVGSSNMDYMSLSNNYEVDAVILGRDFGGEMQRSFARDLAESEEIRLDAWKRRPVTERMKELFSHMLAHIL